MFSVTKTLLNARLVACDGTEQVRTEIKLALVTLLFCGGHTHGLCLAECVRWSDGDIECVRW